MIVAVLGAAGAVAGSVVPMLRDLGVDELRLGDRTGPVERVDIDDPAALSGFCAGAGLVLNCAGPSYSILDRVATAAIAAGAHYVDISGDLPVHQRLTGRRLDTSVVLSAGMLPGLANLVPRLLSGDPAGADLVVYAGGVEPFSAAAAGDLILSVDAVAGLDVSWYGEAFAGWRDGRPVAGALTIREDTELPYFPGRVAAVPFLSADTVRMARALKLSSVDWFSVFTGPAIRSVLGGLRGRVPQVPDRFAAAVDELIAAGELDRGGRDPFHLMAFTLSAGSSARTAVLRTSSSFRLSAATAALTVRAVLDGAVPPGLHYADDVLDPAATLRGVRELGAATLDIHQHDRHAAPIDEGVL